MKNEINHPLRHIARVTIEASSPLTVGSGRFGFENEKLVVKDYNDLPYIPGSSLAGVLRHYMNGDDSKKKEPDVIKQLFGYHEKDKPKNQDHKEGQGSRLIFSSAHLLSPDGKKVHEGLEKIDFSKPYYKALQNLPERDHVRITHKGVAKDRNKYRNQLVLRGTRFVFEVELKDDGKSAVQFNKLLQILKSPYFRIGAGTRNGYGKLKVIDIKQATLDLKDEDDLRTYLNKSSSLNSNFPVKLKNEKNSSFDLHNDWVKYELNITPKNFILLGSGQVEAKYTPPVKETDTEKRIKAIKESEQIDWVNQTSKREGYFDWSIGQAELIDGEESDYIIPATAIKGALSHRVAFHYNKLTGQTIDGLNNELNFDDTPLLNVEEAINFLQLGVEIKEMNYASNSSEWERWEKVINSWSLENLDNWSYFIENIETGVQKGTNQSDFPVGENNAAVKELFGCAKDNDNKEEIGLRGKVIIPDIYLPKKNVTEKTFNHVAIDRFTGGAIDGALFEERVIQYSNPINFNILVKNSILSSGKIKEAWELTLNDLVKGKLALGGNTTKGHGIFEGTYTIKNENNG